MGEILALFCIAAIVCSALLLCIIVVSFRSAYFLTLRVDPINAVKKRKTPIQKKLEDMDYRESLDRLA
jgi:hypothetical protein